jgi:hypothetical protein
MRWYNDTATQGCNVIVNRWYGKTVIHYYNDSMKQGYSDKIQNDSDTTTTDIGSTYLVFGYSDTMQAIYHVLCSVLWDKWGDSYLQEGSSISSMISILILMIDDVFFRRFDPRGHSEEIVPLAETLQKLKQRHTVTVRLGLSEVFVSLRTLYCTWRDRRTYTRVIVSFLMLKKLAFCDNFCSRCSWTSACAWQGCVMPLTTLGECLKLLILETSLLIVMLSYHYRYCGGISNSINVNSVSPETICAVYRRSEELGLHPMVSKWQWLTICCI